MRCRPAVPERRASMSPAAGIWRSPPGRARRRETGVEVVPRGALLDRAVAAGKIRSDISVEDLLRALASMCHLHDQPGWQKSVVRLLDVFIDGLRVKTKVDGQATRASHRESGDAGRSPSRRPFEPEFQTARIWVTISEFRTISYP